MTLERLRWRLSAFRQRSVGCLRLGAPRVVRLAWALPALLLIALIVSHWTDVPHGDQWALAAQMTDSTGVSPSDLWEQHNEHRSVVPRALMVGLAPLTDWDVRVEMAISVTLAIVALTLYRTILRHTLPHASDRTLLVADFSLAVLLLSPHQWENWLWGWQLHWFVMLAGLAAAVALIQTASGLRPAVVVTAAGSMAAIAQLSLAGGVVTWAALVPLLWAHRPCRRYLAPWVAAGTTLTLLYLRGYESPPSPPLVESNVWHAVAYVLRYLGHGLTADGRIAQAIGMVLVALSAISFVGIWLRGVEAPRWAPWVSIQLFALAFATVTATGRSGLGLDQAGASRYTSVSLLFVSALCPLLWLAMHGDDELQLSRSTGAFPFAIAALISIATASTAVESMQQFRTDQLANLRCVQRAESAGDPCLEQLLPKPDEATNWSEATYRTIEELRSNGWLPGPSPRN
jgi:hypothetical protein